MLTTADYCSKCVDLVGLLGDLRPSTWRVDHGELVWVPSLRLKEHTADGHEKLSDDVLA